MLVLLYSFTTKTRWGKKLDENYLKMLSSSTAIYIPSLKLPNKSVQDMLSTVDRLFDRVTIE